MYTIYEDVKLMSDAQKSNFFLSIKEKDDVRYDKAKNLLIKNKEKLENAYWTLEEELKIRYRNKEKEIDKLEKQFNDKKCDCGANLRLINYTGYNSFWGCPNFRDEKIKHSTFSEDYEYTIENKRKYNRIRVEQHWCTFILQELNLHPNIRASELMRFYLENNFDDLREKYGYKSTMEGLGNYLTVSKKSKEQERRVFELLSNTFDNVVSQQGISFREKGSYKKQYRFIDFIASNDDFLFVIEVKLNAHSIDLEQIGEYWELMSDIVRPKERPNRFRTMATVFIVDGESTDNTVSFDELKNLNGNLREIEDLLINKSIMFDPI